jgi:hypothetical protein
LVRRRRTEGNLEERSPDLQLESGTRRVQWYRELGTLTCKVLGQLLLRGADVVVLSCQYARIEAALEQKFFLSRAAAWGTADRSIIPDGCRDLLYWIEPGESPRWSLSPFRGA